MQAFRWQWQRASMLRNPESFRCSYFSEFHSTPISFAKWKNKWKQQDEEESLKPSKNYARYVVRQKRADTKKALKDFLLYGKPSKLFEDEDVTWGRNRKVESSSHDFDSQPQSKSSGKSKPSGSPDTKNRRSRKGKRWHDNWGYSYYEDDFHHHETIYQGSFGGKQSFTWSFPSRENYGFEYSTAGFEWRDESKWEKFRKKFTNESDFEEEEQSNDMGYHSHRVALGLPPTGPLNLDDVKTAFRESALKWHPDKHQGPSQVAAAEKFKACVDAYNSLCSALKFK